MDDTKYIGLKIAAIILLLAIAAHLDYLSMQAGLL